MTDHCAACGHSERDHVPDGEGRFKCTGAAQGTLIMDVWQCVCRSWVEP